MVVLGCGCFHMREVPLYRSTLTRSPLLKASPLEPRYITDKK